MNSPDTIPSDVHRDFLKPPPAIATVFFAVLGFMLCLTKTLHSSLETQCPPVWSTVC